MRCLVIATIRRPSRKIYNTTDRRSGWLSAMIEEKNGNFELTLRVAPPGPGKRGHLTQ
jgi:hypothetical protein